MKRSIALSALTCLAGFVALFTPVVPQVFAATVLTPPITTPSIPANKSAITATGQQQLLQPAILSVTPPRGYRGNKILVKTKDILPDPNHTEMQFMISQEVYVRGKVLSATRTAVGADFEVEVPLDPRINQTIAGGLYIQMTDPYYKPVGTTKMVPFTLEQPPNASTACCSSKVYSKKKSDCNKYSTKDKEYDPCLASAQKYYNECTCWD